MPKPSDPEVARVAGVNLLAERRRAGLTQHELGKRAGLHPKAISHLEQGRQLMMADTLLKLSGALKIEPSILLEGIPPWNPSTQRFEYERLTTTGQTIRHPD